MSDKLFDQDWFIKAVNPTSDDMAYLNQNHEEILRRANLIAVDGISAYDAIIRIAKEMLGR